MPDTPADPRQATLHQAVEAATLAAIAAGLPLPVIADTLRDQADNAAWAFHFQSQGHTIAGTPGGVE